MPPAIIEKKSLETARRIFSLFLSDMMTDVNALPLTDRVALVTGASRGIGRSVALGLAKAGAHVIALARTKAALEELDDQIFAATGRHATLIPFDLTKLDDI